MTNNTRKLLPLYSSPISPSSSLFLLSSSKGHIEGNKEKYLALDIRPESLSAWEFASALASLINKEMGRKNKATLSFIQATGTVTADLLMVAEGGATGFGYRPVKPDTFIGSSVGYRQFVTITKGLAKGGLIDREVGSRHKLTTEGKGTASRFRATPKLLEQAFGFDITTGNWRKHFVPLPRPKMVRDPILLRSSSERYQGEKLPGKNMKVDCSLPAVVEKAQRVNAINTFMADQDLGLGIYRHRAFRRMFNQGDLPSFDWNLGGRLYSLGSDSYQAAPRAERRAFTINGEPVVEIDIKASHLTILHALKGAAMPNVADLYEGIAFPRAVVKIWVTMTLGNDKFHRFWTVEAVERAAKKAETDLNSYSIRDVQKAVLDRMPILVAWPASTIRWGTLQYLESCAVIDAVYELATDYKVVALPIHDSLIVPVSTQRLATDVLKASFERHVGVRPAVSTK